MPENRSDGREQAREEEEVYWYYLPRTLDTAVPHRCQMIDETNGQRCKAVATCEMGIQFEVMDGAVALYEAWHTTEVCDTHAQRMNHEPTA